MLGSIFAAGVGMGAGAGGGGAMTRAVSLAF